MRKKWSCEHVDVIFVILDIKLPYDDVGMYWNKFFIIFSKNFEKSFNFFSGLLPLAGSRLAAELQKHQNGNPGMSIHHSIKPSM